MKNILSKLGKIQASLKSPKNQRNTFGNYNYRSCEDILEALKPLLSEHNCSIVISDDIVNVNDRIYVKATVSLYCTDSEEVIQTTALARESESKKGMDSSQITGASSSYARKYALNGMFAIDDTKDADTQDNSKQEETKKNTVSDDKKWLNKTISKDSEELTKEWKAILKRINEKTCTIKDITDHYKVSKAHRAELEGLINL